MTLLVEARSLPWFWLVFHDTAAQGGGYLGCAIVQSCCPEHAAERATLLGCHPGGEPVAVAGRLRDEIESIPRKYRNRLLSQHEARELQAAASHAKHHPALRLT